MLHLRCAVTAFPKRLDPPFPREARQCNYIDSLRALYLLHDRVFSPCTAGCKNPIGVDSQFLFSFPAWCVGSIVLFMIKDLFQEKSLAFTSGHGRCITVTPERTIFFFEECPLHITDITIINARPLHVRSGHVAVASILKPPHGNFRSETTTWIQKWFKIPAGTSRRL